jgi:IS30 family transposase
VITAIAERHYSSGYLSEGERVRLADLHREGRTMRDIAALMGRSAATISRELRRFPDEPARRTGAVRSATAR